MKQIASFDVFDTLLTRRVATPTSLFLILGDRAAHAGLVQVLPSVFREHRVKAEEEARASAPGREATLEEIHRALSSRLGIPAAAGETLSRLELAVEAEFIVPVPAALDMVRMARDQSSRVLFVSDMYLPASFIRDQLEKHGFWLEGDQLYLSCEWRVSKWEGSLYRKILESERLRPAEIHHTGDRRDADFDVPSRLGIKARHLDVCRLTRYEQMLEGFSGESAGFTSLAAGTSRLTRLESPAATKHLATLSEIAGSLISPVIAFYALWLLREARERGLQRLYFVARDGYLVKRVADALIHAFRLPLETRYLYGSRQAWHLPAITEFSGESLSWLFEKTRTLNLRIVLGRLQMTPEEVADLLGERGWPQHLWDEPLDDESLRRLKTDLLDSADFRVRVEKLVETRRDVALRYLEQEGLFGQIPWAVVDLGWHGRLQQSLEKLLGMKKAVPTFGLYFALFADSPALAQVRTASYLDWDLRSPPESKDIPSLVFLMESFCTAPHGSTVGYRAEPGGRIVPQCREQGFEPLETWGVSTVHSTVERFAENLKGLDLPREILDWDSRSALLQILRAFSREPLPAEARAWGAFPYEDEQAGTVRERLTVPYELTWKNLQIALTYGEERFLPASWKVLWHGAQPHMRSVNSMILKFALRLGSAKRSLGHLVRRVISLREC